jgi:catalase
VANIAGHLKGAGRDVRRRQIHHFLKADLEYGTRVAKALGLTAADAIAPGI